MIAGRAARALAIGALLVLALPARAQIVACTLPERIAPPRTAQPGPNDPKRLIPTAAYTLALSWSPQHCVRGGSRDAYQCDTRRNRFGFVLHGLWPDGSGREWPQYCRPAAPLSAAQLRPNLCMTPSVDLLQHEWARHGTCMTASPDRYFAQARGAYERVRIPEMARLATDRSLTVERFTRAVLGANPGLPVRSVRVRLTRDGWLDELWLCLDTKLRFATCRPNQGGGAPPTRRMQIRTLR